MLLAGTGLTFPSAGKVGTSAGVINIVVIRDACLLSQKGKLKSVNSAVKYFTGNKSHTPKENKVLGVRRTQFFQMSGD